MFLGYIHYFRALAILFIVAGHSIDAFTWDNENTERMLRIFFSNGSVLFVFIAGYLFQHLSGNFLPSKYYKSKLKNVITPYILISIPAIAVFVFILERDSVWPSFYDNTIWEQVGLFYLTGMHLAPLWFIPMILIFYIIAPILVKADRSLYIYFLLPALIILSCTVARGLPHQSFVHFFSVYLLGMCFSRFKGKVNEVISQNSTLFLLGILALTFGFYEFLFTDQTMSYWNFLQKLTLSVFFLGLLFKFNSLLTSKYISQVANNSFGVFFIHSYFLTGMKLTYEYFQGEIPDGTLIGYVAISLVTLSVCSFLIHICQRILGSRSKLIVGS